MGRRAEVRCVWSKRERDWVYHFDKQRADGHALHALLTGGAQMLLSDGEPEWKRPTGQELMRRFRANLEARGLDPDTFTISVRRKKP